jgi:NADH-quinone oxidoreductase subunit L
MTAGLTALYVSRLYFKTFFGTPRDRHLYDHAHESAPSMTIPLWILAGASIGVGYLWLPHQFFHFAPFEQWLKPLLADIPATEHHASAAQVLALMAFYTGMAAAALWFCYKKFGQETGFGEAVKAKAGPLYNLLWNKYYVDEIYQAVFVKGFLGLSREAWRSVDIGLIDATVNGCGELARGAGGLVRRFVQTGYIRFYAGATLLGAIFILAIALSYF